MNNPAIQQALIDLGENLSKIESARTQVNNVAEKSEQLIKAFTKALDTINTISQNVSFDKNLINSQINDSLKTFQSGLSKIVTESAINVKELEKVLHANESELEQLLKKTINSTEQKLDLALSEVKTSSNGITEKISEDLNGQITTFQSTLHTIATDAEKSGKDLQIAISSYEKSFSESLKSITESTDERLKGTLTEVKTHAAKTISYIDAELKTFVANTQKANEQLISFENNVRLLEKKLQDFNLPNEVKNIENKINHNQKQNLIISIIIIIGLIAIAIFR